MARTSTTSTTRKAAASAAAGASALTAPAATPAGASTVLARLGASSPVGGLVVEGVRLERHIPAEIPASQFERLRDEYALEEAE